MAAWSLPASPIARDRVSQLIYLDAFVLADGQSLRDLNESAPARSRELAEWTTARRVDTPIKCFETKLGLQHGELTLPGSTSIARAFHRPTRSANSQDAPRRPNLALL
jgi:hypothetical protein